MSSPTLRALILEAVQTRLETRFKTGSGTVGKWFREVTRGPLKPGGAIRAKANVSDGGQRRANGDEDESGSDRILTIVVTLQLADAWDRVSVQDNWSERVERIIDAIHAWLPKGCGVVEMNYLNDDPADILFASGASEAGWEILFEATYFVDKTQSEAES